jgi:CelD/BcsL family acetyltransferase involved in cellulose biosynthesis
MTGHHVPTAADHDPVTGLRNAEWVDRPARFAEMREPWNRLAASSLFLTWEWLDAWWTAFADGGRMQIRAEWRGEDLVAGLAMGRRGRHLFAMANRKSDLFSPVRVDGTPLDGMVDALAAGPWSRVTMPGMPKGDPETGWLAARLREHGWLALEQTREVCPIVETSGSFDDYMKSLGRHARNRLRNARRRLERAGRLEVRAVRTVDRLGPVLEESLALEARGWKGRSRTAVLSSERDSLFWRLVLQRFHALGTLRFSELRLDGRLLAFCIDVVHGDRVFALKTGYDEDRGNFSPGHVLRLANIERCFEEPYVAQELMGPIVHWKQRYATDVRETVMLRAYRRRPLPAARYVARSHLLPRVIPGYRNARDRLDGLRGRRGSMRMDERPARAGR